MDGLRLTSPEAAGRQRQQVGGQFLPWQSAIWTLALDGSCPAVSSTVRPSLADPQR